MVFLRVFAEILKVLKNQDSAKSAKSISAPDGPIWLKFLLWVLELIIRHSIKQLFLLKINISVQKRGVYFLWQNPKRKGSTMEFHTFCKSVLWSCSDPKTFLIKCSSKKVSMMPSKGQVSNPSRLRDTELSVYFLRLTTVHKWNWIWMRMNKTGLSAVKEMRKCFELQWAV